VAQDGFIVAWEGAILASPTLALMTRTLDLNGDYKSSGPVQVASWQGPSSPDEPFFTCIGFFSMSVVRAGDGFDLVTTCGDLQDTLSPDFTLTLFKLDKDGKPVGDPTPVQGQVAPIALEFAGALGFEKTPLLLWTEGAGAVDLGKFLTLQLRPL